MARTKDKGPVFHLKPLIELIGLKEVIDQAGVKRVIDEVGLDRVIDELGRKKVLARLVSQLSAEERAELKRRLNGS